MMTLMRYTPSNLPASAMRALAPHWGALLGLALFLIAGLAVLDDYGVHWDEYLERHNAEVTLRYLANGDFRAWTSSLWTGHDQFYGVGFSAPLLLAERAFGIDDPRGSYLIRHLHTRLFFLVSGLFAYMLARRLFGSRPLAVAAMLLFLLHPRLYAHSFFNPKDIPFLAMFIVALFLAHRAFKRDSVAAFALLGVGVGLLANLRIMGLMLLAAVPAMRAVDFVFAQGWAERKRILLTTGGFALAGGLTIYALLPYLWPEPGRAVEWWTTLSSHPHIEHHLFRGAWVLSVDAPSEYLPVWFSITAPPFALLLGVVGHGRVLALWVRAPLRALRNTRLRFALLLIGCFALPAAAVILLGATVYNGWRHLYFLWAPFALLAAFGLQWTFSALGRARLRTAAYGAATAGLAATVVAMALLHPNQWEHFNFLVDRVAPEHLRSQYEMDYWNHSTRQALERLSNEADILRSARARVTTRPRLEVRINAAILPDAAQARLSESLGAFRLEQGGPDDALLRAKVYGNTILAVSWKEDLRAVYEEALRRERIFDGVFDVYQMDGALALVKEPCAPSFLTETTMQLRPVSSGDPTPAAVERSEVQRYPLVNLGALFEGKCIASIPSPNPSIAEFNIEWDPELLTETDARDAVRRAQAAGPPLARSSYSVYLGDGALVYVNDSCDPAGTEDAFYLDAFPERAGDLPQERRARGFERERFQFYRHGALYEETCAAVFPLPDYPIVAIQTGQRAQDGSDSWSAMFSLRLELHRAAYESTASNEPVARGEFDIHLAEGALVYVKEPCEQADTEARFFLHITPERIDDLPDGRRRYGFDNLDFAFFLNGALFQGNCAARIPLPDYPISSIRTGQYVGGVGEIWSAEFAVGR